MTPPAPWRGRSGVQIDWAEYSRVHADRTNLLIHLFAVPLFAGSIIALILCLVRGNRVAASVVVAIAVVAMALQGRGHRREPEAPRPFTGAANFLRRWFAEQFLIFPAFVLSGRWWRRYRDATDERQHES